MQFSKNDDYDGTGDQSSDGYMSSVSFGDHEIDDILSDERLSVEPCSEEQNERFQACFTDRTRTSPTRNEKSSYTGEALDAMRLFMDRIIAANFSPYFKCATGSADFNFVTDPYMIARAIVAALLMQKSAELTQKACVIGTMSGADDELVEIHLFEYNNLLKKSAIQGLWAAFGRYKFPELKEFENVYKAVHDLRTEALLEMTIHFLDAIVLTPDDYTSILPSSTFTFGDKHMYAIVTRFAFNWCELFPQQIRMDN